MQYIHMPAIPISGQCNADVYLRGARCGSGWHASHAPGTIIQHHPSIWCAACRPCLVTAVPGVLSRSYEPAPPMYTHDDELACICLAALTAAWLPQQVIPDTVLIKHQAISDTVSLFLSTASGQHVISWLCRTSVVLAMAQTARHTYQQTEKSSGCASLRKNGVHKVFPGISSTLCRFVSVSILDGSLTLCRESHGGLLFTRGPRSTVSEGVSGG